MNVMNLKKIMLKDSGNGIADVGELAINPVTGDLYKVLVLQGPIIAEQGKAHQQAALGVLVDPEVEGDPLCEAVPAPKEEKEVGS